MGTAKEKTKQVVRRVGKVAKQTPIMTYKVARTTGRASAKTIRKIPQTTPYKKTKQTYQSAHYKYAAVPHQHLIDASPRYATWHNWRYKRLHHGHVHYAALALYILFVGVLVFNHVGFVFAADLSDNWDFGTPADFALSDGVETSGTSARLKAQEYSSDANTAALYHLNETSGSAADDASSNNNDLTLTGSPSFGTGNLNNGLTLDGNAQYGEAADSASLSMTGQQTIEGWIKTDTTFNNSADQSQTIVDKGSYRLAMNRTSGKIAYEIENNNSNQWTKRIGDDTNNGGWTFNHTSVDSMINYGSDIIAGTGQSRGDAEVWKWNGTTWVKIGGDGLNSSWPDQTYEQVLSLASNGTALYAGLGNTAGDAEVWTCDMAANCATWSKIGGDGIGGISASYSGISSMAVYGGSLYAGTGITGAGNGDVWKYNGGTSWTQIGGDTLNSSWASSQIEQVAALYSDGTYLYAGLGVSTNDADIWRYNGTSWTQIGGDGIASSYTSGFETVHAFTSFGGNLYAAVGDGGQEASVWRYNGTSWAQIGGNPVGGWNSSAINVSLTLANDGTNLYVGNGAGASAGEVFRYTGSTWTKIGGSGVNSSWTATSVGAVVFANSKLYAAPWSTTTANNNSMVWEWNGSAWTNIGGNFVNDSWGGNGISRVDTSTTMNGKMYIGLGTATNSAHVYEYDGTNATRIGGAGLNGSWAANTYEEVSAMTSYKGELYVGLGTGSGNAEVWKWNGSTWTQVGGNGVSSSWNSVETMVESIAVFNGKLYIGLGYNVAYSADIWEYDGSTWTQVAGEAGTGSTAINNSWKTNPRGVDSMVMYDNQLCAGVSGNSYPELWCWTGSGDWTKIGGGNASSTNGSWSQGTSSYIYGMTVYNGKLIAAVTTTGGHVSNVWSWDGSTWTQIGGGDVNGSWPDGMYSYIRSMVVYNGNLYLGTSYSGSSNPTGDVWRYNGTSWTQVGGDGINSSWATGDNREEVTSLIVYKGKLYAGLGYSANNDALLYSFGNNGYAETSTSSFDTSWKHIVATYDGINMKLYINGVLDSTTTVSTTGVDNSMPLLVGSGWGGSIVGDGQSRFKGQLDEIRISNTARTSFTSQPYPSDEQSVTLASAVRTSGVESWDGFADDNAANGGTITYRLSDDDGFTWKYWDGGAWAASSSLTQANSVAEVSSHIGSFPVSFSGIRWQAVLKSDGTQRVQLNSVTLTANSDTADPTNISNLEMYKSNGGDAVSDGDWTNSSTPYFSWTAGSDGGAGILGYCLYLGTSSSADPAITKGILGTSPVNTGGNCQFAVSGDNVDLSSSGYISTALTTSDSPYYLNVKAIDNAGNVSSTAEHFSFKFDNTPPSNPGFITAPSQFVSSKEVTFAWPTVGSDAPSDANSGLSGLQYRIGSGSSWYGDGTNGAGLLANDGSYTTRTNPDYANINEGNNTVYFRTWDQAGNVTTTYTTAALKLNTTSPASPQNVQATPTTNTTNSFAFSWDTPATFSGSANSITYCYTVNTAPTVNTCTFTAAGVTSLSAGAFATQPGENTFYVVAKDEAGNINYATAASTTFTANTSAPGIPLDIDIADVSVKSNSSWKLALTWEAPSDVGAGVSTYKIYRSTDSSSYSQIATTSGTSYVDSGLDQVHYYYKVRACDSANNCGAYSTVVDDTPTGKFTIPATLTAQPSVSGVSTKKATIKWATNRNSDSKISLGTKSGSYEPFQVASSAQVTDHTVELANLTPGTTYFAKAVWTDEDGNSGTSSEFSFKTEPAPTTQEVLTRHVTLSSAQIRFTSVSAAKVVIQFGKSDTFGGQKEISTSLSKSTYDVELTGLDDGSKYFYRLNTFDAEGNEYTGSTVLTFTTPARPRIENLRFQPVGGEPTSTQRITWRTNVATSSLVRFLRADAPAKEISNSQLVTEHEVVVRDLEDDTEYTFVAESRDKDGNLAVSDTQVLKTALDTRPPKISDITIETTIRGTGAEARGQIVVSWKTDEPATSQVAYAEGSDAATFNNKTSEDTGLALEHIVIVSDLPTSRVYTVKPISNDRSSNSGSGEPNSAIIGRASDSVMTIILNTLQKVFGF